MTSCRGVPPPLPLKETGPVPDTARNAFRHAAKSPAVPLRTMNRARHTPFQTYSPVNQRWRRPLINLARRMRDASLAMPAALVGLIGGLGLAAVLVNGLGSAQPSKPRDSDSRL